MNWQDLICAAFLSYGCTLILTRGHIFQSLRELIEVATPRLGWAEDGLEKHFIRCHMCVGFWVSIALGIVLEASWLEIGAIYGFSYFLVTQEN